MIFFGGVGSAVVIERQRLATEKLPKKRKKRLQTRKIIWRRSPFICIMPRQKRSIERRMICKVLPLYGLSTVQAPDDRRKKYADGGEPDGNGQRFKSHSLIVNWTKRRVPPFSALAAKSVKSEN
jgi:hypothetical protein